MGSKMLIDAAHPEETRVVVVRGNNRIEELDYEAAARKRLRGNIYLAKVTRVEPSLQAAFVDYGGNRHGFLAFNEIHPDYYQIPFADRQALLEQEAAEQSDDDGESADDAAGGSEGADDTDADAGGDDDSNGDDENGRAVESVGSDDDAMEEVPRRSQGRKRSYKIQEVIKRRQVILVQVVKEERGNKGAALTTYLSLAGRYCVLMPNTARGGGISRKISDAKDRKRLKEVTKSISVPEGMGLIVRTAGASRNKSEIKRDFDYLIRLWENVRDLTLKSTAPSLVYEEGSLIKRAIRDLYSKDIEEVLVEGEAGYKEAKDFMRMLTPSHARHVKLFAESQPLFMKQKIENQLDVLYSPQVTLPSGGYIVINQTEALVAIDVNSGKATREHNIEDTALRTNLEAAEEVARQMRLRDLAGLIVIDFIDMEERRNNRSVERKLKDKLKSDRARIQIGRISHFGLLEMSRQRMRSGVLESSTRQCPTCEGRGIVRSVTSAALHALRGIEDHLQRNARSSIMVRTPAPVIFYILNQKRDHLLALESTYGVSIFVEADDELGDSEFSIEKIAGGRGDAGGDGAVVQVDSPFMGASDDDAVDAKGIDDDAADGDDTDDDQGKRGGRRRRRRGRRGGRQAQRADDGETARDDGDDADDGDGDDDSRSARDDGGSERSGRSRRGRRGGRRRGRGGQGNGRDAQEGDDTAVAASADEPDVAAAEAKPDEAEAAAGAEDGETDAERPRKARRSRKAPARKRGAKADEKTDGAEPSEGNGKDAAADDGAAAAEAGGNGHASEPAEASQEAAANGSTDRDAGADSTDDAAEDKADEASVAQEDAEKAPPRRGWWQRRT